MLQYKAPAGCCVLTSGYASDLQVIVVNYEDSHTTMEAPDEDDESAYK